MSDQDPKQGRPMTTEPLDLDEAAAILADNGIDGPDLPYNPRALAAMRTADALLAELVRARAEIERLTGPGTETRTEWAVRWNGYEGGTVSYDGEVRARYCYEFYAEGGGYAKPGQAVELLTREVRIWAGDGLYALAWSVVESSTPGAGIAEARAEAAQAHPGVGAGTIDQPDPDGVRESTHPLAGADIYTGPDDA